MKNPDTLGQPLNYRAWVVFSNETDLLWLRILKRGYRHCFVIINDGKRWVSFDPMAHYSEIIVHDVTADFDMPAWLTGRGYEVVKNSMSAIDIRPAPPALFSCVEAVKRVLGIHRFWVFTPWQLCKYLRRQQNLSQNLNHKFHTINNKETAHGQHNITA